MLTTSVSIISLTLNFSSTLSHGFSLSLLRLQLSLLFSESISRIFTFILFFIWTILEGWGGILKQLSYFI